MRKLSKKKKKKKNKRGGGGGGRGGGRGRGRGAGGGRGGAGVRVDAAAHAGAACALPGGAARLDRRYRGQRRHAGDQGEPALLRGRPCLDGRRVHGPVRRLPATRRAD